MSTRDLPFSLMIAALAAAAAVAGHLAGIGAVARYLLDAGVLFVGLPALLLWSEPSLRPDRAALQAPVVIRYANDFRYPVATSFVGIGLSLAAFFLGELSLPILIIVCPALLILTVLIGLGLASRVDPAPLRIRNDVTNAFSSSIVIGEQEPVLQLRSISRALADPSAPFDKPGLDALRVQLVALYLEMYEMDLYKIPSHRDPESRSRFQTERTLTRHRALRQLRTIIDALGTGPSMDVRGARAVSRELAVIADFLEKAPPSSSALRAPPAPRRT